MENTVNVLWTGGWDSTFRMLELAMKTDKNCVIQPIYVSGDGRKSEYKEIMVMREILPLLRKKSRCNILELKIIDKAQIPQNEIITKAFDRVRNLVKIGTQYEWLARLAVLYPGIELGIELPNGEYSGCVTAINKTGKLSWNENSYYIDKSNSSSDCNLVFGNFSFPIINRNELDMVKLVHEWKCESIMKKIWFCHLPINDEVCGFCRPCQQKMECEMEWLLPKAAQKRYKMFKAISKILGEKLGVKIANHFFR